MRRTNFDSLAAVYRWCEYIALGGLLQRARTHFLPHVRRVRSTVVVGDGDGRFAAALMRANTRTRVLAVDSSERMLQTLRRRCEHGMPNASERLTTQRIDAREFAPEPDTELVVTHFVLDCFRDEELRALVKHYVQTLRPGTLWLVSDFGLPQRPLARTVARLYIAALYMAFRLLTGLRTTRLPDIAGALAAAGLRHREHRHWLGGFIVSELWQVESRPAPTAEIDRSQTATEEHSP